MKKVLIPALLLPSAARAHAGDHSHDFAQNVIHAISEPDHLLAILGVLALAYFAYRFVKG